MTGWPPAPRPRPAKRYHAAQPLSCAHCCQAPRAERPFFARFFETQLFHGHLGARLDADEARARAAQELLEKQVLIRSSFGLGFVFFVMGLRQARNAAASRFDALVAAERAAVKELEALLEDHARKLAMARERLEALQLARFEMLQ